MSMSQPMRPSSAAAARSNRGLSAAGLDASLHFIGTATMLLRFGDLRILTDPNFIHAGEEIPLGYGLTTTRVTNPAMEIDALPDLDLVLLSHFHADHFDRLAEERLDHELPIVTTPEAAKILAGKNFVAAEGLETWETRDVADDSGARVRITSMPGKHAPAGLSVALPDVMGSMLEVWPGEASTAGAGGAADPAFRMYISGDTIMYGGLHEIHDRYPQIDLGVLHLGGTRVMGITVTMDAGQGVELMQLLNPVQAVPIHYDDYEAFKSPLSEFVDAVRDAGLEEQVVYVDRGQTLTL